MTQLRIGFDARAAVLDPRRGIGRVTRDLAEALIRADGADVVVFVHPNPLVPEAWYHRAEVVHLKRPTRGAFLFDPLAWRWALRRHLVNVLHLPAWGVPPGIPAPVVSTLYDVTPIRFPGCLPSRARRRAVQRLHTHRRATVVHAISNATALDATHALGIAPGRVHTELLGIDHTVFCPADDGVGNQVLFVGGGDGHKRIELLIDMWCAPEGRDLPTLVLAGSACTLPTVVRAARQAPERVRPVGEVAEAELVALYRTSMALLLPSLWEGFGLPALEAMACGCVPIVTDVSSLPEVVGDAGVLVSPDRGGQAWANAVRRLREHPEELSRLRAAGIERAARMTWDRTAEGLMGLYRETAMRALS